jgi:hypothetical protein
MIRAAVAPSILLPSVGSVLQARRAGILPGGGGLASALSLLRAKGGSLYLAGPANREASDGSGTAPDGIGTDPIGYVLDLASGTNKAVQPTTAAKPLLQFVAGKWLWQFDGVDDRLLAPASIGQANGNLICVSFKRLSAATGRMLTLGATGASNEFFISFAGAATAQCAVVTSGATSRYANVQACAAGDTLVFTAWLNGGQLITRTGGVQREAVTHGLTLAGSANQLSINANRLGSSATTNTQMFAVVASSGVTTLAEVQQIERAVAQAAGVTLP